MTLAMDYVRQAVGLSSNKTGSNQDDNPYFPSLAQQLFSSTSSSSSSSSSASDTSTPTLTRNGAGASAVSSGVTTAALDYFNNNTIHDATIDQQRYEGEQEDSAGGGSGLLTPLADASSSQLSQSTPNLGQQFYHHASYFGQQKDKRVSKDCDHHDHLEEIDAFGSPGLSTSNSSLSSSSTLSMPITPTSASAPSGSVTRFMSRLANGGGATPTTAEEKDYYSSPLSPTTAASGVFKYPGGLAPLLSPTLQAHPHHHPYGGVRPSKPVAPISPAMMNLSSSSSSSSNYNSRQPLQPLDANNMNNLIAGNGQFLHPAAARKAALAHAARLAPAMQAAKSMPGVVSQFQIPPQYPKSQQQIARASPLAGPPTAPLSHQQNGMTTTAPVETGTVSSRYLSKYPLPSAFSSRYQLGDELGSGGFGFVVVANRVLDGREVAVKFIFRDKVPVHGWIRDDDLGVVPIEVAVLRRVRHAGVIEFIDYFETGKFSILVMELFGKSWGKEDESKHPDAPLSQRLPANSTSSLPLPEPRSAPPSMTAHPSMDGMDIDLVSTAPNVSSELSSEPDNFDSCPDTPLTARSFTMASSPPSSPSPSPLKKPSLKISIASPTKMRLSPSRNPHIYAAIPSPAALTPPIRPPLLIRRSSHDLFECIEAAGPGGFTEEQVQYIFAQVVEVVWHLESLGVCHRDIKDENIVIDDKLRVKIIDFGSASVQDPSKPPRYYDRFYGTVNAAAPEILSGRPYLAPQAEVWSLGVLLYTILFGECPFANTQATLAGRISTPRNGLAGRVGRDCREVLGMCLEVDSINRATVSEIRASRWIEAGRRAFRLQNSLEQQHHYHRRI